MKYQSPCTKDCPDRVAEPKNCHTYCKKYLDYLEIHKKEKARILCLFSKCSFWRSWEKVFLWQQYLSRDVWKIQCKRNSFWYFEWKWRFRRKQYLLRKGICWRRLYWWLFYISFIINYNFYFLVSLTPSRMNFFAAHMLSRSRRLFSSTQWKWILMGVVNTGNHET